MNTRRHRSVAVRGRLAEFVAFFLGASAALLLGVAATQGSGSPDQVADQVRLRRVQAAADLVQASWQAVARAHDWWALSPAPPMEWSETAAAPRGRPEPKGLPAAATEDDVLFDLLLATAGDQEREGRPAEALKTVGDALGHA